MRRRLGTVIEGNQIGFDRRQVGMVMASLPSPNVFCPSKHCECNKTFSQCPGQSCLLSFLALVSRSQGLESRPSPQPRTSTAENGRADHVRTISSFLSTLPDHHHHPRSKPAMPFIFFPRLQFSNAVSSTLIGIGSLWLGYYLWNTLRFTHLHFIRPSSLNRYKTADGTSWALVTGASDGIGKGFAEELCRRGFHVVLHGRNEKKLNRVRDELLEEWPQRQIRILVLDAVESATDPGQLGQAVDEIRNLKIKVLVNNVGGAASVKPLITPLQHSAADAARIQLDLNVRFQTELSRLLLPQLIQNQPSCILNVGSASADLACCYLSVAAGVKAYQKAWSRSLSLEMKAEGNDVEVLYYRLGIVSSGSSPRATSLLVPSSRTVAAACLDKVGCGRDMAYGYWPHELQFGLVDSLPAFVARRVMISIAKAEMEKEREAIKSL